MKYQVWRIGGGEPEEIVGLDAKWEFKEACQMCRRLWLFAEYNKERDPSSRYFRYAVREAL